MEAREAADLLCDAYPDAAYPLNWRDPVQLLVASVLAAQCTDERVNQGTPGLFAAYPNADALAGATPEEICEHVRQISFCMKKSEAIRQIAVTLRDAHGGEVPDSMEELVKLPRVARKTANVVLCVAFGKGEGVLIDGHAARVSTRLGVGKSDKPEAIETAWMAAVPQSKWAKLGLALTAHGRKVCNAREPACGACVLKKICPKLGVDRPATEPAAPAAPAPATSPAPAADYSALPESWGKVLADELAKPYFRALDESLAAERDRATVFPPADSVFTAFHLTPFDRVKAVILGQDPYHGEGQAHGLSFSVLPGVTPPPSLKNMFKELRDDLGIDLPEHGYLARWAEQGVLLLNTVLTVRAGEPNSHKGMGWETFTDAAIRRLSGRQKPVVFVLWGSHAQKKAKLIDAARHPVIESAHPSPLSAKKFSGSRPFSKVNAALEQAG